MGETEAVAQRRGDEPRPGGGADEGEMRQLEPDGACTRPLPYDDVDLEVLHGRIEDLLDGPVEPVYLVDEEHIPLLQVGEDGRHVGLPLERRARGGEMFTPISTAMMLASVVLPSPGGPARRTWSSGSPRDLAASMKMPSCSRSIGCPTKAPSERGRSERSSSCSSGASSGSASLSGPDHCSSPPPRVAGKASSLAGQRLPDDGFHRLVGLHPGQ